MDSKTIKVLSIEDNPGDARLIQVMLFDARSLGWDMPRFELEQVDRLEAGLARLEAAACHPERVEGSRGGDIDVVLTDLDLPDSRAGETFATLHARFPHLPVVVLTGREDEALAVNTVRAGAEDYLYKREMSGTLLAHALSYAIERQRAKDALQRAHDALESRVRARTAELAQANAQLQRELEGRERAEADVRASEAKYRGLLQNIQAAVVVHDAEGHITSSNSAARKLLHLTEEQIRGRALNDPVWHMLREDGRRMAVEEYPVSQVLMTQEPLRERVIGLPDSSGEGMTWVLVSADPNFNVEGDITQVIVTFMDITKRKRAEERLAYLNAVLHAIRNVNQLITQESDRDRLLQRACENLVETLGFYNAWIALVEGPARVSATYAAGFDDGFAPMARWLQRQGLPRCGATTLTQTAVTVITEPSAACVDCPLAVDYRTRGGVVVRLGYRDKVYGILMVSVPLHFVRDIEVHELIREVAGDIAFALWKLETEAARQRAEEALRRSERELQLTLDATTDGIWKWNFKTNELFFSPRYYRMLGYEPEEFPANYENWAGLIHPEDRTAALAVAETYLETKPETYHNEFRMRTKEGTYRWIQTEAKVVEWDEHGEAVRMIGHHRDVTARKRAEKALEEREAVLQCLTAEQRIVKGDEEHA
jgi:PAS domain S-box-containing protein